MYLGGKEISNSFMRVHNCREAMELNATDENVTAHNKTKDEFSKFKIETLRNTWRVKPKFLSMEKKTQTNCGNWHISL